MRALAFFFLASACVSSSTAPAAPGVADAPGAPDAPTAPDAPPAPGLALERLDWRTERGAPYATSRITLPAAELFALSEDGFVTREACADQTGCTYTWRDLPGTPRTQRERMIGVTLSLTSPDGRLASLVAVDDVTPCTNSEGTTTIVRGKQQLLDLATGASRFELALRSNIWSALAFTSSSEWFFSAPNGDVACSPATLDYRAVTAPFQAPPGLDGRAEFVEEVDGRRWLALRDFHLGLIEPHATGSFVDLGFEPALWDVTAGWVHVYIGQGNEVQAVQSIAPDGASRRTTLPDVDWFPLGAAGRFVRVCGFQQEDGTRSCRVVDTTGATQAADVRVTSAPDHHDDAVLLADGAIVFVGPTDEGTRAVQRVEFASGRREVLHAGDGQLRPLGDGAGALLYQDGVAWLIEATREERLAEHVSFVLTAPRLRLQPLTRNADLAGLAIAGDGVLTYAVLDIRTRRLATLTDRVYLTPTFTAPFASDDCGQPWSTRHAGARFETLLQDPRYLFFVETGAPAAMWLVPVDLSAPPRRLGTLGDDLTSCHAPLDSPDGGRVGFVDSVDGDTMHITLSQ